jgi:hypothetical protein
MAQFDDTLLGVVLRASMCKKKWYGVGIYTIPEFLRRSYWILTRGEGQGM